MFSRKNKENYPQVIPVAPSYLQHLSAFLNKLDNLKKICLHTG